MQTENLNAQAMSSQEAKWYAVRTFHNKSSVVRHIAETEGVDYYTPLREIERVVDGRILVEQQSIMPSLLFLHTTHEWIARLKALTEDNILPYCEPGTSKPQAIADSEMELFRFVARTAASTIECIDPSTLHPNDRVRITGGVFQGYEGYIRRVHGTKRFVVAIEGIAAIATTFIPKQYIEKLA